MANTHKTLTALFSAIADAIRAKTGSTAKIVADDFPDAIAGIAGDGGIDTSKLTATEEVILDGATAYVASGFVTGKMPNKGTVNGIITTKAGTYTIPKGYHAGSGTVSISPTEQAKIIANNIRSGVSILGVTGTMTSGSGSGGVNLPTLDNPGTDRDVASGKQFIDANGHIIIGRLSEIASDQSVTVDFSDIDSPYSGLFLVSTKFSGDHIMRTGATASAWIQGNTFGDATPDDVVNGKTFTSSAGLTLRGRHECVGGAGSGGLVVRTGSVTVAAPTDTVTIETGLSSITSVMARATNYTDQSNTYGWHAGSSMSGTQYLIKGVVTANNFATVSNVTISGGTITLSQYDSAYPIIAGTIAWEVYGEV